MTTRIRHSIMLLAVAACIARAAVAQGDTTNTNVWQKPVHLSALVGESLPLQQWRNSFQSGDDGAIALAWPVTPGGPIWLEGQFNGQSQLMLDGLRSAFGAAGAGASIYSFTLNGVVNAHSDRLFGRLTPYFVGGGGWYARHVELDNYAGTTLCSPFIGFCGLYGSPANRTRTQNVPGWDLGGGLRFRLSSLWVVAEARYNAASTRYAVTRFVPIVVGVTW
jgi:hypothetical protein